MVNPIESEPPVVYLGSRRKSLLSKTLLAFAGWMPLGDPCPGMMTPPLTVGRGGTLIWLPSIPIRKALVGSENPLHAPVVSGAVQTERSPKPIPSARVRTSPTPFFLSNARDQPPRSTVFLLPRRPPSSPLELGFQARSEERRVG